jgi:surfactin synthase thioesterase subunit
MLHPKASSDTAGSHLAEWIWLPKPRPQAPLRLYCLAHAGAGASAFASWAAAAPPEIEIAAIRLPGRETRLDEEPLRRLAPAARSVAELILLTDARPFALFGHSLGGKLAVHTASLLEDTDRHPVHVFVSATPVVPRERTLHKLDDAPFIRAIADRYGPLPVQITDDPELLSLFARPLRADLEAHETDEQPPRRLGIALTVISGSRDTAVASSEVTGWRAWSSRPVHYETLDADHFSYRTQPHEYLGVIRKHLFEKPS